MIRTDPLLEKVPPHSYEAEQATLGAVLLERSAAAHAIDALIAADFYDERHAKVFETATELFAEGAPIDLVTMTERLRTRGEYDLVGGQLYLAELIESVPTAAAIEHYAKIVRNHSLLRGLIVASHRIIKECYDAGDRPADEVIGTCEQMLFSVSQRLVVPVFRSLKDLLQDALLDIERIQNAPDQAMGARTGFRELDTIISGLQDSEFIVIASRPSVGKTALALNIATRFARQMNKPVALYSLEMAGAQLALRWLCSEGLVDMQNLREAFLQEGEMEKLASAADRLYQLPIYVDDASSLTALQMMGKARRLKAEHGLGLVIVDYLQLIQGHGRFENRQQEISVIARALKTMARELRVPVIALSQLSRAVEARTPRRPYLSDLRESGSIEAEADLVLMLYRPGIYGQEEIDRAFRPEDVIRQGLDPQNLENIVEVSVAKQRNGPTGTARLMWQGRYTRFTDLDIYHEDPA